MLKGMWQRYTLEECAESVDALGGLHQEWHSLGEVEAAIGDVRQSLRQRWGRERLLVTAAALMRDGSNVRLGMSLTDGQRRMVVTTCPMEKPDTGSGCSYMQANVEWTEG